MNTTTKKLYIDDNGSVVCTEHAGCELSGAIENNPRKKTYFTTLGTWMVATSHDYISFKEGTGYELECESCRDWSAM